MGGERPVKLYVFDAERVRGQGRTIKAAEMDAACRALELIGPPPGSVEEENGSDAPEEDGEAEEGEVKAT